MKMDDLIGAFAIDISDEKKFHDSVDQAADAAIQICGPRKALEAAMMAQHVELHEFFSGVTACLAHQKDKGTHLVPMTVDMVNQFNRCVATTALVSGMMAKNVLDAENVKPLVN